MRSNLLCALRLLIAIGKEFDFKIYVFEMSTRMFTDNDHGYVNFGVPDLQLELECYDLEPGFPLWCMEISFLQSSDEVVDKLKRFAAHPDIIALTLFDISEFVRYSPPKDDSVTVEMLGEKDVLLSFREWSRSQNHPLVNGVSSFGHTWIHPLSVTITSWLRPREGTFDLDDYTPGVYASAVRRTSSIIKLVTDFIGSNSLLVEIQTDWRASSVYSGVPWGGYRVLCLHP